MILGLTILNSLAFIVYGVLCLATDSMVNEFKRYGLLRFRVLTGYLELLGGLGCLIGYFVNDYLFQLSCAGLALLMTMGVIVRIKVKDPLAQTVPAIVLGILNYYLLLHK